MSVRQKTNHLYLNVHQHLYKGCCKVKFLLSQQASASVSWRDWDKNGDVCNGCKIKLHPTTLNAGLSRPHTHILLFIINISHSHRSTLYCVVPQSPFDDNNSNQTCIRQGQAHLFYGLG